jgi:exodeoxyribonuclease VII small subunit
MEKLRVKLILRRYKMPKKNDNYEEMMTKLEKIVDYMENGQLTLEESMRNYEDGIKLCNKLYKILNEAEGKIKILTEQGEVDFMQSGE